ncbi:hypothetical protein CABS01_08296, partial [Colletotrichum abscissum]|uniref:uncharacterized protein n=1 Tax=Colletotrichum abscissum TaxID=1671311 RepID=UPI0027D671E2
WEGCQGGHFGGWRGKVEGGPGLVAHACSWSRLEPINNRLMQWCATLLAPWSFVLCTSPFAGFPVDGPLGWTVDRDLMELHPMPPPATAAPSQSHSVTHTHTHTRGHKRASRRMLEAGRRTETDQTSPLGSLQACKSTYSPWIDAGAGASTPARRQHLTSRTSHAEETLKNTLGK